MTTIDSDLLMKKAELRRPSRLARLQSPAHLFGAAVVLGLLFNLFVLGRPFGIGVLLFVITAVAGMGWVAQAEKIATIRANSWLILPLLFFATMLMLRTNQFLVTLNFIAILCLLAYLIFFWAYGRSYNLGLVDMMLLPFRVGGYSGQLGWPVVKASVDVDEVRTYGRRGIFPILRGLLFVLPILFVFTILLSSADTIFADRLERFFDLNIFDTITRWIKRAIQTAVAIFIFSGALAYMVLRHQNSDDQSRFDAVLQRLPMSISIGLIEVVTMLLCINVLFASFVAVQFTYLFGGYSQIGFEGFTYANYARRGFFELLAVAVMAVSLILGLNWLTRRESKRQITLFNVLSTLLISFVLVMLVSAFWRMRMYEMTYAYTESRLIVYVFIGWMALTLLWFVGTLWLRPDRFAIGVFVAALGFLVTLNLINPDRFIAKQNLAHFVETGSLDVYYLMGLSDDAVPVLATAVAEIEQHGTKSCPVSPGYNIGRALPCSRMANLLVENLQYRHSMLQNNTNWQSYNLSRWQATHAIQPFVEEITK